MVGLISRRDFLKISGASLVGMFLADLHLEGVLAVETPKQGRSTFSGVELLAEPFRQSPKIHAFGQDEVISLSGAVEGELGYGNRFNSTWYRVHSDGYVYSGAIQPVDTVHHKPILTIPERAHSLRSPFPTAIRGAQAAFMRFVDIVSTTPQLIG